MRVDCSGKFSIAPSEIQLRGSFLSTKLENTNPISGTANNNPAATLTATPAVKSQSRREGSCAFCFSLSSSRSRPLISYPLGCHQYLHCLQSKHSPDASMPDTPPGR